MAGKVFVTPVVARDARFIDGQGIARITPLFIAIHEFKGKLDYQ